MKKLIVLFLSAFLLLSVSAATLNSNGQNSQAPVTGRYVGSNVKRNVYSVEIVWGDLNFTYNAGTTIQTWDPATHSYVTTTTGTPGWSCENGANLITVTNHSDVPVQAELVYTPAASYTAIAGTFDKATLSLAAAAEGSAQNQAPYAVATLTLSGALPSSVTASTQLGTVTLTIRGSTGTGESGQENNATPPVTPETGIQPEVVLDKENYSYNGNLYTTTVSTQVTDKGNGVYEIVFTGVCATKNGETTSDGYVGFTFRVNGKQYSFQKKDETGYRVVSSATWESFAVKEHTESSSAYPVKIPQSGGTITFNLSTGEITGYAAP